MLLRAAGLTPPVRAGAFSAEAHRWDPVVLSEGTWTRTRSILPETWPSTGWSLLIETPVQSSVYGTQESPRPPE